MVDTFLKLLDTDGFIPHGICLLWHPVILYMHVISDLLIAASYYSIPLALIFFVSKRKELEFRFIFILFGAFILACGTIHLIAVWTIWHPIYLAEGVVKVVTAIISITTAMFLWPLMPKLLRLPSPSQLEAANVGLQREIHERASAEEEVRRLNTTLEKQVVLRTQELMAINRKLQQQFHETQKAESALRETNERVRLLLDSTAEGLFGIDREGKCIFANPAFLHMFGYENLNEVIDKHICDLIRHETMEDQSRCMQKSRIYREQPEGKTVHVEYEVFMRKDGNTFPAEYWAHPIRQDNQVVGAVVTFFDITERKERELELRKLSRAVEQSPNLVLITNARGEIEYVNSKVFNVTGYRVEELMGKNPRIFSSGETTSADYKEMWNCITAGNEWHGMLHNRKKNGELYWVRESIAPVKDEKGNISHFVAIQEDITEAKNFSEQLSYHATHDQLTGLINRYEFERRLEKVIQMARAEKSSHALCYLDLDQFKIVNDSSSHAAGDELLRQIGTILQRSIRKSDSLARLGGDEFGILIEHCSTPQAEHIVEHIRQRIEHFQFLWEDKSFRIGSSIGLVPITDESENMQELLKLADAACYVAKDSGRNRVHVYRKDDEKLAERQGELLWVSEINQAFEYNRFRLYAQPIVEIKQNGAKNRHYELLVRLENEQGEIIPPGAFLPSAERYNLSSKLDRWVVQTYLTWLGQNPQHLADLSQCAINLSGQSIGDRELLRFIFRQFKENGISPRKICFEVTETTAIANLTAATAFIKELKAFGCQFSLDDFGSGLSSFAYLKNLPVDYLKIDGMFVRDILDDPIDLAMVKSINEIGHVMGKKTIAEFVENRKILHKLRELGVDYAQGYGIGKPGPLIG